MTKVLLNKPKRAYAPFFIAKKSTRQGWNLSKYSIEYLSAHIDRIMDDMANGQYEEQSI